MLVSELKQELEKYDKKELVSIVVELYKRIPKTKKEDYNIDEYIKDIKTKDKVAKKKLSFEELEKEITYFLQCVDNELYVVPNKIISKKERSGWRFKVKRYYKELNNIPTSSLNGDTATTLLIEIFKRLSIGSNTLLFINWETFRALGVSQASYYDAIIKRILSKGYSKENIQKCIELLEIPKDPYELSFDMFEIFISNLKIVDNRLTAIEFLDAKIKEFQLKLKSAKDYHQQYVLEEKIDNYTMCITNIYFILHEVDKGIDYFQKHCSEASEEVKEYIILEELEKFNLDDYWLKEYESKMKSIDFRDSLKKRYNVLKKNK